MPEQLVQPLYSIVADTRLMYSIVADTRPLYSIVADTVLLQIETRLIPQDRVPVHMVPTRHDESELMKMNCVSQYMDKYTDYAQQHTEEIFFPVLCSEESQFVTEGCCTKNLNIYSTLCIAQASALTWYSTPRECRSR